MQLSFKNNSFNMAIPMKTESKSLQLKQSTENLKEKTEMATQLLDTKSVLSMFPNFTPKIVKKLEFTNGIVTKSTVNGVENNEQNNVCISSVNDKNGNELASVGYKMGADGKPIILTVTQGITNSLGQFVRGYATDFEKKESSLTSCSYNPNGTIRATIYSDINGKVKSINNFVYNNNKLVATITTNSSGLVKDIETLNYQNNKVTQKIKMSTSGEVITQEKYSYDENGNKIRTEKTDTNGNLTQLVESKYDENNIITETTISE